MANEQTQGCGAALFGGRWIGLGTCGVTRVKGRIALCDLCEGRAKAAEKAALPVDYLSDKTDAYRRGFEDGAKGRSALFRNVRGSWEPTVDDAGADAWTQEQRRDYAAGLDDGTQYAEAC